MTCTNHNEKNEVNTCSKCGSWLCEDCSIEIDGRIACKTCIAKAMNLNTFSALTALYFICEYSFFGHRVFELLIIICSFVAVYFIIKFKKQQNCTVIDKTNDKGND